VRSTDQFGASHDQVLTIDVNDFEGYFSGSNGGNTVEGTSEEDTINANSGNDTIRAGTGDDIISGGFHTDRIYGEAGNDTIDGGRSNDWASGGAGDDQISGGGGTDTAIWSGELEDFAVSYDDSSATFTITDLNAADGLDEGTDTVTTVEKFDFGGTIYSSGDMITEAARQANTSPDAPQLAAGGAVAENSAEGTVVATLGATDVDGDTLTYTLTDAGGSPVTDSNFEIVGNEILVKADADLDFENATSHHLYVTASDAFETSDPTPLTIAVDDVAEALVASGTFVDTSVAEDSISGGGDTDTLTAHDDGSVIHGNGGDDTLIGGDGDDILTGDGETNLVVNGSFEDLTGATLTSNGARLTSMTGWTEADGDTIELHTSGKNGIDTTDGDYWLDMTENGPQMDISQEIFGMETGESYQLIFDAGNRFASQNTEMDVYFGGELIATIDPTKIDVMEEHTFDLTGGSGDGSNELRFVETGTSEHAGTVLDDVRVFHIGDDQIDGGAGDDTLSGGGGDDTFLIGAGEGNDTVSGGTGTSWTDTLDLQGVFGAVTVSSSGDTVTGEGWTIALDSGNVVSSDSNELLLDSDASGLLSFDGGGSVDFDAIERVVW